MSLGASLSGAKGGHQRSGCSACGAGCRNLAGWQAGEQTAQRQIAGVFLNGQLLSGFFIWLRGKRLRSVGDFFASTVLLHDPDGVLQPGEQFG
jgi:hypothetical protein